MNAWIQSLGARALLAGLLILAGSAPHACAQSKRLSQPFPYLVGDDIAIRMAGILRVVAGLEASTLVYFDRKDQRITAHVVGTAVDAEGAKGELEAFVVAVRDFVYPYAKRQHGVDLTDRDVTLIYINDGGEGAPSEVLRRVNGVYKTPEPPPATQE